MTNDIEILHETMTDLGSSRQSYALSRTLRVNSADPYSLQVLVDVDSSYPGQSRYTAKYWSSEKGWVLVTHIFGKDPSIGRVTSGHSRDSDAKRETLERIAGELVTRARAILG